MTIYSSILLGIIQGLTEFLPVSSSGHLVIAQSLLPRFSQPGVLFDVTLHLGTLFSILIYFRKKILSIKLSYIKLIIVGTIPAVTVGFLFMDFLESLFTSTTVVGVALLLTGAMDHWTDMFEGSGKKLAIKNSLLIGSFQAMAIIPGISRSGSTIFAGSKQGIDKKEAAEFSFLLSVPAVLGANLLEIVHLETTTLPNIGLYVIGFIAASVSGYFAISLVYKTLVAKQFKYFGLYCFALGILVLGLLH
jgi:undecaprenyl-diphosphatase